MAASGFLLIDTLTPVLVAHSNIEEQVEDTLEDYAGRVEDYAKANASWSDITGDAREGLTAEVSREGEEVVLELSHTVDYGVWLETRWNGRYAIIMPTLEYFSREILNACHAVESGEE